MADDDSKKDMDLEIPPRPSSAAVSPSAESAQSLDTKGFDAPPERQSVATAFFENQQESKPASATERVAALASNFGRYRLQSVLGRGGMGEVYLAYDTTLRRNVALKAPRLVEDSPVHRDRFFREARSAAALHHPNICPLHDVGEFEGQLYLTMAYIDGEALSAHVRRRGLLPIDDAVELVRKVARAMQHAHECGLLHRDLKPGNILLTKKGEPVVTDFGLAFRFDSESGERLTETGIVVGTPTYMPPEQINSRTLGPASDVYSLGVVLYELLTGKLPFEGSFGTLIAQIETAAPEPPSRLQRQIDPALEAICLKALAKQPAGRFADMAAFAQALEDYEETKCKKALADEATAGLRRQVRRRVAAVVSVALVAAAAATTAAVLWARRGDRDIAPVPEMQLTDADRLFDALNKSLVKIDCTMTEATPVQMGRNFIPASLLQFPAADGNLRVHTGPLYFSISGHGTGHVLDLSDQPGQAAQITQFGGEITVKEPYLLFLGNLSPSSRVYIKGGPGYSILAPMNGGPGSKHVEFDGTHFLKPKINDPRVEITEATGADRASLQNPDLIQKCVWSYDATEYVIFCRPGTKVVPGNHELRKDEFPQVYYIIEADRARQGNAPRISNDQLQRALREAGRN
jgi:hypothetical protein